MMKDLLKKKMQHVINIHIHPAKSNDDKMEEKESDLAPEVKDKKMGAADNVGGEYVHEMTEGDIGQNETPMSNHAGPQATADDHRMNILQDMGAYAGNKNPKGLRAKAMHAAGKELDNLKAKKGLKKS